MLVEIPIIRAVEFLCKWGSFKYVVLIACLATPLELISQPQAKPSDNRATELRAKIEAKYTALEDVLDSVETSDPGRAPLIKKQMALYRQFVLGERFSLVNNKLKLLVSAKSVKKIPEDLLSELKRLHGLAEQIDASILAEMKAEQIQVDTKMYFKMRVRAEVPPKALKAFGLMALASQERDAGEFEQAFTLWQTAEDLVNQSYNDHIAYMAEYREHLKANAADKRKKLRVEVEALLGDHFVKIPAGKFLMGNVRGTSDEQPIHEVSLKSFYLGKTEVTFELFDYCVELNGCYAVPEDEGWGRDQRPVINVSYKDIQRRFLPWLNDLTGRKYRLPSESEWEYAARAGSDKNYSWGDQLTCAMARFDGGSTSVCGLENLRKSGTVPVGSYQPNKFGLYDMHGNVWEWVQDCWNTSYKHSPVDGSPWMSGNCSARVLRGGAWNHNKNSLLSSNRYYFSHKSRMPSFGFRLAYDEQ